MTEVTTSDIDKRLSTHEAVCAERYTQILDRLSKMEKIIVVFAISAITGMATILANILFKL